MKEHLKGMKKYKYKWQFFLLQSHLVFKNNRNNSSNANTLFSALAYTISIAVTGLDANENGKTSIAQEHSKISDSYPLYASF